MRKIIVIFLVCLTLVTIFSVCASGVKVWPGKLDYTINRWYTDGQGVKHARIQVTNTASYDIDVSVRIDHPHVNVLDEGYSQIPDLSWVKANTEMLHLPADSSDFVEVYLEVPESKQSSHYNEKWESYVVISSAEESEGGINFQTEVAVKLFIKTPTGEASRIPYIFIIISILFLISILYMIHSYIKNKRTKPATYYFKKRK